MINASKEKLASFFNGQIQYVVPFYQRTYVWKEENWDDLWEGIWSVYDGLKQNPLSKAEHFIGTLITKQRLADKLGESLYDLIDGQQRLTTILILLKAMAVSTRPESPQLRSNLEALLSFVDNRGTPHIRIRHSRIDSAYFDAIVSRGGDLSKLENQAHAMIRAYNYFKKKLEVLSDADIDLLMTVTLHSLTVVSMLLAAEDDEQVIFDTINSLGVKLSTAELLKNFVFQGEQLQELYDKYWVPVFEQDEETIEFWSAEKTAGRVKRTNVEVLLYSYLVLKQPRDKEVRQEKLFKDYKDWLNGKSVEQRKEFLRELTLYAETYFEFPSGDELAEIAFGESEKRFFHVIENLEISTILPLVLYIYTTVTNGDERNKLLGVLESYVVRRNVCRLTTKNYNNFFIGILNGLENTRSNEGREICVADLVAAIGKSEDATSLFPTDAGFAKAFETSALSNKHAGEILFCIGLKQKSGPHSDVHKLNGAGLSVEHMMPRKWETNWMKEGMTASDREIRNDALRTLGNLTLVTSRLNSKMQNAAWIDKKVALKKYSSLEMTTAYVDRDTWDESNIRLRAEDLLKVALSIWPRPAELGDGSQASGDVEYGVSEEEVDADFVNTSGEPQTAYRQKWDEEHFTSQLATAGIAQPIQDLASQLRDLASKYPATVSVAWGSGKAGSMILKRNNSGLIEVRGSGSLRFRPNKFVGALGEECAVEYQHGLELIVPESMKMAYPRVAPADAPRAASAMLELIQKALDRAERNQ